LAAPVTDHDKIEDCPLVIEAGEAANESIEGRMGGGTPPTVTGTFRVTLPTLFVAVKV